MIIIVHKITMENPFISKVHNKIPIILRPWWVREGAGKVRYWNLSERYANET